MPEEPKLTQRVYLLLQKQPAFLTPYTHPAEAQARLNVALALITEIPTIKPFKIVSLPSRPSVMMTTPAGLHPIAVGIKALVVTLLINPRDLSAFQSLPRNAPQNTVTAFGIDAPVRAGGYWAGGIGMGNMFSKRETAERLIKKGSIALTGQGVHVALIDSGLDTIERQRLGMTYGHTHYGQEHLNSVPYAPAAPRYDHAFQMARNFKMIAPNVTLHDYAVLPSRLSKAMIPSIGINTNAFLSDMVAAYVALESHINLRHSLNDMAPWVICNSWSIYKRTWNSNDPNANPNPDLAGDPLNKAIDEIVKLGADIIFCAGNGGQFGNDPRCGADDRGPGRSIIGSNGHPNVITVGSVRTDGGWIGSSSQGPGIMGTQPEAVEKPDLVAPSDFAENGDSSQLNSGTSTACAMTAAVVAAIREGWPTKPRAALKSALIASAWQMDSTGWNNRTGHGILDAKALIPLL